MFSRYLTEEFDFPPYEGEARTDYIIACTRRSGSTWLASHIWQEGDMGAPWEYFNPGVMAMIRKNNPEILTDEDYFVHVKTRRTSPNGVFSHKIFFDFFENIYKNTPYLWARAFTKKVIFLRRRNEIAQAISLTKARMSGKWAYWGGFPPDQVEYDFQKIAKSLRKTKEENCNWEEFFDIAEISPLNIWYEDMEMDINTVISNIRSYLGIHKKDTSLSKGLPMLLRQRDMASDLWEERFREELLIQGDREAV